VKRLLSKFFSKETRSVVVEAPAKTPHELACAALLDEKFYLQQYPDIAAAAVDPLEHYTLFGYAEGRLPRSIHSQDALGAIQNALILDPTNVVALEFLIAIDTESKVLERVASAAARYNNAFTDRKPLTDLAALFEQSAIYIFSQFHQFRGTEEIPTIVSLMADLAAVFNDSATIQALHAMSLFELGDLHSAEKALSALKRLEDVQPDVQGLCVNAVHQIWDAKAINNGELPDSKLLILDSFFPSEMSSFRYGEFSAYLEHIDRSAIHIKPDHSRSRLGESMSLPEQLEQFSATSGVSSNRLRRFDFAEMGRPKVAYCVFLNLADLFFSQIGTDCADHYIFTLYPGGGFAPNDLRSDTVLRRLCDNPRVSKIITTQNVSYRYLVDRGFCMPDRVCHVFGVVIPYIFNNPYPVYRPRQRTDPLNVCFVAHRYSAIGAEKGYDVFAKVVTLFANSPFLNFHVVGDYDESIVDVGGARNIRFCGIRPASFFHDFYGEMDIILSPIIQMSELDPSYPGMFDGFPTTTVVEAGLRGVAMMLTDFQDMNQRLDGTKIFSDDEMVIINRDPYHIADLLNHYVVDRDALETLGRSGQNAILREFSFERQMKPRIDLLQHYLLK